MSSVEDDNHDEHGHNVNHNMQLQMNRRTDNSEPFLTSTPSVLSRISGEHCHTEELPDDTVARNQLIAVCILCFLFMVGEIAGRLNLVISR